MAHELDRLDAALADRVTAYAEIRTQVEVRLRGVVQNVRDLSDQLISRVEEFGVEHALDLTTNEMRDSPLPGGLAEDLEQLVDAQEQIDQALLARETVARGIDDDREQRVSVQGEIFRIDRSPGQYPELVREEPADLSLTQQFGLDHDVDPAQPIPDQDRWRSR